MNFTLLDFCARAELEYIIISYGFLIQVVMKPLEGPVLYKWDKKLAPDGIQTNLVLMMSTVTFQCAETALSAIKITFCNILRKPKIDFLQDRQGYDFIKATLITLTLAY